MDLNDPPYNAFRDSENLIKPEKDTLGWLLEHDDARPKESTGSGSSLLSYDFIKWRDCTQSGALLVKGAPGQGKSVLSNFVLYHLEERQKDVEALQGCKIIYHFCNIRIPEKYHTAEAVLRSLIVQLCEARCLFMQLPHILQRNRESFHAASFDTLWYHFQNLLLDGTFKFRTIYCVVDGLDVYKTGMKQLVENLAKLFHENSENRASYLKLFCTSRPTSDLSPML